MSRTALSVNLNKIALLRNSRGENFPCVLDAARACVAHGCAGITVHPRPDMRHIRPSDVGLLKSILSVELNIEGNPYAGATPQGYPGFLELVKANRPAQCTLVPDADQQLTSDHGFNLATERHRLKPLIGALRDHGIRVSLFVDPDVEALEIAAEIGANRIEIYTGPYAKAFARGEPEPELEKCVATARSARSFGLGVNAGHDLNQQNLGLFLSSVPDVMEVSIGHALIVEAIYQGLPATLANYSRIISQPA